MEESKCLSISCLCLTYDLRDKLLLNGITHIGDLVEKPFFELLALQNITLFDVAYIKEALAEVGCSFLQADYINLADFGDPVKKEYLDKCQKLWDLRQKLIGNSKFTQEILFLDEMVCSILLDLKKLGHPDHSRTFQTDYQKQGI